MRCPHCKNKLVQKSGDVTRVRVQGVLEFDAEGCRSRCYWCKQEVTIPIRMSTDGDPIPDEEAFHLQEPKRPA